jgi:hypothetical protein
MSSTTVRLTGNAMTIVGVSHACGSRHRKEPSTTRAASPLAAPMLNHCPIRLPSSSWSTPEEAATFFPPRSAFVVAKEASVMYASEPNPLIGRTGYGPAPPTWVTSQSFAFRTRLDKPNDAADKQHRVAPTPIAPKKKKKHGVSTTASRTSSSSSVQVDTDELQFAFDSDDADFG